VARTRRTPARSARSAAFDAALSVASATLSLVTFVSFVPRFAGGQMIAGAVLMIVHSGALYWRRTAPWIAFAVNLASAVLVATVGLPTVVLHVAPLVAIYSLSSRVHLETAIWALGLSFAGWIATAASRGFPEEPSTMGGNAIALTAAWMLGTFIYKRQEYVERLETRTRELEEAREELAARAVAEERLRLARELHDIVAHSLSMIAVQSGMGEHVIDERPEEARRALGAIQEASRQALDEMRRVVGVLRDDDGGWDLAPVAGIDDLPALVTQVAEAGPDVELRTHGDPRPLAPGVSVTSYRIVQESLTNVVKHSHASKARVSITYAPDTFVVEVVDDGRALTPPDGKGHGLEGMRERVEMFGGRLEAGPLRDGGFRVLATIPDQAMGS
jgi:signal transduction histidine kinase